MLKPHGPLFAAEGEGSGGGGAAGSLLTGDAGSQGDKGAGAGGGGAGGGPPPIDPARWRELLPAEFAAEASLKDYKDFAGFVKSHVHLAKSFGDKIPKPREDWTPEQWNDFYTRLGRPSDIKGYDPKFPEGYKTDQKFVETMLGAMHEAGLTKAQANKILERYVGVDMATAKERETLQAKALSDAEKTLKETFKDKFDESIKFAQYAVKELGSQELVTFLEESGLGNNPQLVILMSKVGTMLADDRIARRDGGGGVSTPDDNLSAAQALAEIKAMETDTEQIKALSNSNHPKHSTLVARRMKLYKLAYDTRES